MIIRRAFTSDIDAIVEMGQAMHAESPRFVDVPFSIQLVRHVAEQVIDNHIALVAEHHDQLVGVMAGMVTNYWFSHAVFATDLIVYVRPEHRGSSAFVRLVGAFESAAFKAGATEVLLGVSAGISADAVLRSYSRMGYAILPGSAIKELH